MPGHPCTNCHKTILVGLYCKRCKAALPNMGRKKPKGRGPGRR